MPPKTIGTWAVRWTQTVAPFPGQACRGPRGTSAPPRGPGKGAATPGTLHEPADRDPAPQGPQGPDGHVRHWRELRPRAFLLMSVVWITTLGDNAPAEQSTGKRTMKGSMMTTEPRRKLGKRKTKRDSAAERERREKALETGLEDSSPASDPVAAVQPAPSTED